LHFSSFNPIFMLYFPIIVSLFSLLFVFFLIRRTSREGLTIGLSQTVKEGERAFLKTIAIVAISLFFILWLIFGFKSGFAFLIGSIASIAAGFMGIAASLLNNVKLKAVETVKSELKKSLELSFKSSSVAGFSAVGLGLLVVSVFYLLTNDLRSLIFLGFGGSLISVFARIGEGVFTKLNSVSKTKEEILKNGVENINSCIGTTADLFETYVIALVSAMILAGVLFSGDSPLVFLPILLGTIGILASIIGSFFVNFAKKQNIKATVYKGLIVSGLMAAAGFYPVIRKITSSISLSVSGNKIYLASLAGLAMIAGIFMITEYFASKKHKPVKMIASASQSGYAGNIIIGLAIAMQATILPTILIFLGVFVSFWLAGIYGVALATVAMVSLAGIIISIYAFGVAVEKAGSVSEMPESDKDLEKITDALNDAGNAAKSMTDGYSLVSAGLASLVIFFVFSQELMVSGARLNFSFDDPRVIIGLFLGGLVPYLFSFLIMTRAGRTADSVINEIRRQFSQASEPVKGDAKSEQTKGVDAFVKLALKEMLVFSLILVLTPIAVGFVLGPLVLAGVLIGSILAGIFLGIFMTLGVTVWSNAKKYIEEGNYGGKDSLAHQAAVIGDAIANSYKDTAGLAINPMIKIINIVALLIVSFLV